MKRIIELACLAASVSLVFSTGTAKADAIENFYHGKTLTLIISTGVGGGYDAYGRPLSRHISEHIPGKPSVVVQNMPGGGGLRAMNYLYSAAPKDGTTIGLVHSTIPYAPLYGIDAAKFDATKVNWIASLNKEVSVCVAWHDSPAKTLDDLFTKQLVVGSVGVGADMELYPLAMNRLFNTKFKVINGYKGGNDIYAAMERGEIQGRCGVAMTALRSVKPNWVAENKLVYVVQTGVEAGTDPLLKNTASIIDRAKDPETRQVLELLFGNQLADKPVLAPPEVPAERVAALRAAVRATVSDPDFMKEMNMQKMNVNYVSGEDVERAVKRLYASPPAVVKKLIEITTTAK